VDDYEVSTEDEEIAQVARHWGARVLGRPAHLTEDGVPTLPVLQHVVYHEPAEVVVLLQATSPIRDEGLIDSCIQRFLEGQFDSLATGFTCKLLPYGQHLPPRQDIPGFFVDDGNVYVMRADLVRAGDRFGENIGQVLLDREQNLEIDDPFDFWMAEQIIQRRLKGVE
jgi:N-acylneuraminate cytidylyltransferase